MSSASDLRPSAARRAGAGGEWDFDVPLLPGDHVTDDAGTGFVHTAPSHGDDDYEIGRARHGLKMTHNVLDDGSFRPTCRSSAASGSSNPTARRATPTRP
jgi:isoleucyl-tRNA synthetase